MMVKNKTRYIKRNIKETTSRKQMESELIKSESRYRNLVEFSPEAICTLKAGKINLINVSGSMLLGALSPLQLIGKPLIDFIHPEYQETVAGRIQEILTTKRDTHWLEVKIIRLDGSIIEVEAKASLLTDEEEGVQLIAHNVTHYKEAEREIIRLNRLYSVLSNVNQAIVRIRNQKNLFDEVCRVIVEEGHFTLAWIGLVDRQSNRVNIAAIYSKKKDFIKKLKDTWDERNNSFWHGPSGMAIHQGKCQIINDVRDAEFTTSWRVLTKQFDIKSVAAFPIKVNGESIGNLTVDVTGNDYFHEAEINLLNELVSDLSYALEFMVQEEARRKTEEKLRENEERYQQFLDSSTDMVLLEDENLRYVLVNESFSTFFGKKKEEIIGKTVNDIFPDDSKKYMDLNRTVIQSKKIIKLEETHGERVFETRVFPVNFDNQKVGIGAYIRDITEQKMVGEELRQSYENLNKVMVQTIQSLATTIEMRDPYTHGHQERVAKLATAIADEMRYPKETVNAIKLAALVHDIGKIRIPAEILSKPGKIDEIELNFIKTHPRAGFEILNKIQFREPVAQIVLQHHERLNGSGYPYGLRGEDILPEAKIMAVADVVEAMASHRPYRPALGLNRAMEEIFQNRNILYDPLVVDSCIKLINEQGFRFDSEITDPTRSIISQKLESIGQMAAGIAHEINTPIQYVHDNLLFLESGYQDFISIMALFEKLLTTVKCGASPTEIIKELENNLQSLDQSYLAKEIPIALEQSLEGTDRITRIVKAIKDFAHPSRGERSLADINQALESTITISKNEWKYFAELDLNLDPSLPMVNCIIDELNQVFLNMLINASDAVKEKISAESGQSLGKMRVTTRSDGDRVRISFQDNGIGINPENLTKIFSPFFTTKGVGKGTGQGLAIAYNIIVTKHKGSILVDSEPGIGSTFTIVLPVGIIPREDA